ncbi:MAG: hypothetical protein KDA65_10530 [Planctomycetaceae bacterium]|nr:hypothetical protein [Planctomycetaceae bacterium]
MSTATKQTSPAFGTHLAEATPSEDQSTLGVVQKLQQKLRSTRENLERLRVDRAEDAEAGAPHIISDKIANQLRLVNQERMDVLQQLGATGNEKLRDVVSRMKQELDDLRMQNESLQKRSQSIMDSPVPPQAHLEPAKSLERTPFQSSMPANSSPFSPKAKTVLEQELLRKEQDQSKQLGGTPTPVYEQPELRRETTGGDLSGLLTMLEADSVEEGIFKLKEMRELCQQYPQEQESLKHKNMELTKAVKKMHADQIALCKRFNVNSLSEMAKLIMETMDIKKQNGERVSGEVNSWVAVADLLQDWDKKIHVSDPNHTVKVERTGSRWNLSANWLQK